MTKVEMIEVPKKDWESALEDQTWLRFLEAAGVDNWEGIYFAYKLREEEAAEREKQEKENSND